MCKNENVRNNSDQAFAVSANTYAPDNSSVRQVSRLNRHGIIAPKLRDRLAEKLMCFGHCLRVDVIAFLMKKCETLPDKSTISFITMLINGITTGKGAPVWEYGMNPWMELGAPQSTLEAVRDHVQKREVKQHLVT